MSESKQERLGIQSVLIWQGPRADAQTEAEGMAVADDIERIRTHGWPQLQELWRSIVLGQTPDWGAGKAMEYLILRAFELDGADVVWPYSVPLHGEQIEQIDGAVYCGGLSCLVESKATTDKVNIEPIAKLRYQLTAAPFGGAWAGVQQIRLYRTSADPRPIHVPTQYSAVRARGDRTAA